MQRQHARLGFTSMVSERSARTDEARPKAAGGAGAFGSMRRGGGGAAEGGGGGGGLAVMEPNGAPHASHWVAPRGFCSVQRWHATWGGVAEETGAAGGGWAGALGISAPNTVLQ